MPELSLTPASISYLTQLILSGLISGYLVSRLRKPEGSDAQSRLLAWALTLVTVFISLLFLDLSLLPTPRLYAVYLENTALALALTLLIQFAYHFPSLYPCRKWEARLALAASLGYTLYEAGFAVYRYDLLLTQETVEYRSINMDVALLLVIVWLPLAFLRQATCADPRPLPWLKKLLHPHGEAGRALLSFTLIYLILPVLALINLWRNTGEITTALYNIAMSAGALAVLLLFILAYINYLPETTSFMIKLSGITLTILLTLLGIVGWVGTPTYIATYQPALQDRQTLRFTPNGAGGYAVSEAPFRFETDLGERLDVHNVGRYRNQVVDFVFPFFGKIYSQIYVTSSGLLSLGAPLYHPNLQNDYGHFPGIFPLLIDLEPTDGNGVYARKDADRLVVTWNRVQAAQRPEWVFTFQAILYADGRIDFAYNGLPETLVFDHNQIPSANPWLRGLTPGLDAPVGQADNLTAGAVVGPNGLVQDFHNDFRRYLGRFLNPLATVALGGSLVILIGLPFLFYSTLIQPLEALLVGIRNMDKGNLGAQLTIKYRDEIGFLTRAFNEIGAQLNALVNEMERQVNERTQELAAANEALQLRLEEVEALKEKLQEQAIHDPLTGLLNRRYLNERLECIFSAAKRNRQPVGMILFDIDHFKKINDAFGHQAGDQVLQALGNLFNNSVRKEDLAFRIGGEEFLIVMPGSSLEDTRRRAEEIRQVTAALTDILSDGPRYVTLSAGVAAYPIHGIEYNSLYQSMDRALYQAKQMGRNKVVLFSEVIS
ncbi:MAG: diguanylate cyclase [Chloroflexi bacterium]|nr:diguanylate cyclase [Chloroflexota bacterium]MCA2002516.1 diguanylate cyclase [Chloroflexota bacterium]